MPTHYLKVIRKTCPQQMEPAGGGGHAAALALLRPHWHDLRNAHAKTRYQFKRSVEEYNIMQGVQLYPSATLAGMVLRSYKDTRNYYETESGYTGQIFKMVSAEMHREEPFRRREKPEEYDARLQWPPPTWSPVLQKPGSVLDHFLVEFYPAATAAFQVVNVHKSRPYAMLDDPDDQVRAQAWQELDTLYPTHNSFMAIFSKVINARDWTHLTLRPHEPTYYEVPAYPDFGL